MQASSRSPTRRPGTYLLVITTMTSFRLILFNKISRCLAYFIRFFGRKKMQPAFEKASFGLGVGGMSDVVDTSSGVHVILRLA